jgi:trans-aconitate 2-methyltransferase
VSTEWDARTYERVSDPQVGWAAAVLGRIPLRGDESVLDAGCGTGRVTRMLAERVPRGRVLGVDASRAMVAEAAERLADLAPRVSVRQGDLLALEVDPPVDLIVSTATFHWVLDHDALFRRLYAALRPGGRLAAQCGGAGNIAATLAAAEEVGRRPPYAAHLDGFRPTWTFAGPEETVARLDGAGFERARAWLEEAPAPFDDVGAAAEFLATVVVRHHLERLPPGLGAAFAREVAARRADEGGRVVLDYVRLNLEARRPAP